MAHKLRPDYGNISVALLNRELSMSRAYRANAKGLGRDTLAETWADSLTCRGSLQFSTVSPTPSDEQLLYAMYNGRVLNDPDSPSCRLMRVITDLNMPHRYHFARDTVIFACTTSPQLATFEECLETIIPS